MFRSLLLSFCATLCLISAAEASQRVNASECRLFELAYKVTNTQKGAAFSDILVGCPGYEDWTSEMSIRQNSIAFQKAQNGRHLCKQSGRDNLGTHKLSEARLYSMLGPAFQLQPG